ncbi:MAG: homoserine dehydrogenase [Bacteroidales bacterium]|nr:homoserine dehydrogenase [Bacteroidales bacterium]
MRPFNVAILGCGTVGGGVARIMSDMKDVLSDRASCEINLKKIVELDPKTATERFNLPFDLFCGGGKKLTPEEATIYTNDILASDDIDLVVETIGGSSDFVYNLVINICKNKKHLVTANKALLAERGKSIFECATENGVTVGYEAAVCGAIPIIKAMKESFSGDKVLSVSGILNGTSNYILTMMQNEGLSFIDALKMAQENGYAEADPTLDISGGDAGHKLAILIQLAFGIDVSMDQLPIKGIQQIDKEDIEFAEEIDAKIKLICFAKKIDSKIYATVCPMMVKKANFLSGVNGATNAVRVTNKYGGRHIFVGAGAGSLETASSIVSDIVFTAKHPSQIKAETYESDLSFIDAKFFEFPYIITFETQDVPGVTGLVTTSIGNQNINIDTVSHNRHKTDKAVFSIATMPCTLNQIMAAIKEIRKNKPDLLINEPKVIPILY